MQKVDVQMSPKPYDTKRLWCSQGDTGLRKFGFHLMDGIDEVDISNISDPVFSSFQEYVGGTEELLPTNTSTPSTSPILADIQYSDGLREDQSFTYRESPVTKDGKAKVNRLKGNTIVWNQLVPTNAWTTSTNNGITWTNNGDGSYTVSGTSTGASFPTRNIEFKPTLNHKYLVTGCLENSGIRLTINGSTWFTDTIGIFEYTNALSNPYFIMYVPSTGRTINTIVRPQIFDLTQMGLDITDPSEFTNLFPLSYYDYNVGTLLPFKGEGIKTVGKNLLNIDTVANGFLNTDNGAIYANDNWRVSDYILIRNGTYTLSWESDNTLFQASLCLYDSNKKYISGRNISRGGYWDNSFTVDENPSFVKVSWSVLVNNQPAYRNNVQLESGSTRTEYEPYTESTTSLPISTYFPTGMNRVNDVYDELTQSKATKRLGMVDLGSLNWTWDSSISCYRNIENIIGIKRAETTVKANIICPLYETRTQNNMTSLTYADGISSLNWKDAVLIKDPEIAVGDTASLKAKLNGVYLVYELATPLEQSITSASLVTERTELPLYVSDGLLVADCTEDLSSDAGIFDAKIRFTDADGDCYSNKLKISVEARP